MSIDGNNPAFPVELDKTKETAEAWARQLKFLGGLTKREYFAALAMQGMLGNKDDVVLEMIAKNSVLCADALIKELGK